MPQYVLLRANLRMPRPPLSRVYDHFEEAKADCHMAVVQRLRPDTEPAVQSGRLYVLYDLITGELDSGEIYADRETAKDRAQKSGNPDLQICWLQEVTEKPDDDVEEEEDPHL